MNRVPASMFALALLLSACGGGGGDSFGGSGAEPTSFPIDGSNGVAATRLAWEAAIASGGLAELGSAAGVTAAAPGDSAVSDAAIAERLTGPGNPFFDVISLVPFGPDTYPCEGGTGSVTVSGDIAVPGTFTRGDTFLIVYELCDEGFGEVIDGTISLTVRDFAGDLFLGTYLLSMDADIDALSVTTATDTIVGNGDAQITLDTTETPYVEAGVSGAVLMQDSMTSSETLRDYSSFQTFDGNQSPAIYTMEASGMLDSSQLPGDIGYATEQTFIGNEGEYPNQGTLLVSGDNSSARLVAIDATNIRIDIDSNGDGVVDEMIDMTWAELAGG